MDKFLCELVNASLGGKSLDSLNHTDKDWQLTFDLAWSQGVLAMTFPVMASLPKEQRPSLQIWAQWMYYTQSVIEQTQLKRQVVEKIGTWLAEDGLSTIVLKGFSLSTLYPNPHLREFNDIDIYSGERYNAVNDCFKKHGFEVGKADGHHTHFHVDGVSIEHHFAFSNSRLLYGLQGPDAELQRLAVSDQRETAVPGISFPCPAFTALHTGWHAYEHFLNEKIQLRHVIDWALALRQLSSDDANVVYNIKNGNRWGMFLDTLTAIALRQLNLPSEWFPRQAFEAAQKVEPENEKRVWNDIITASYTPEGFTRNHRRVLIVKRMLRNRWKFNNYASISAERFAWEEFLGYVKNRKQKNRNMKYEC